jgi:hypothetical protein
MANAGILYDKYTVIQKLQKRGFSHEQAEVVGEVLTEADLSSLATKSDLKDLKLDMIKWMVGTQLAYAAIIIAVVLTR